MGIHDRDYLLTSTPKSAGWCASASILRWLIPSASMQYGQASRRSPLVRVSEIQPLSYIVVIHVLRSAMLLL